MPVAGNNARHANSYGLVESAVSLAWAWHVPLIEELSWREIPLGKTAMQSSVKTLYHEGKGVLGKGCTVERG